MSVENTQLAGFLSTGNRGNFLYVEGSTAWLYDCPHFLSPLYKADRCFNRKPIQFNDTLMHVDPITRQTCDNATPIACDNSKRTLSYLILKQMTKIFTFVDQNPLNETHHFCLHILKLKLQYGTILSQLKMLACNLMLNLINSGTEYYIQNTPIQHFNF